MNKVFYLMMHRRPYEMDLKKLKCLENSIVTNARISMVVVTYRDES